MGAETDGTVEAKIMEDSNVIASQTASFNAQSSELSLNMDVTAVNVHVERIVVNE